MLIAEMAVNEGIRTIQVGIQNYAVDHNDTFPPVATVTSTALVGSDGRPYVDGWPANPYTLAPMTAGTGPGDYRYARTASGFVLTGFGPDGRVIIRVP